ncbi:MAG: glycine-rich protein, partial [bacterium]|nr:glycine-rich protein [bacterium]MDY4108433.1 glycine-rich protein [Bacilli bacterium]
GGGGGAGYYSGSYYGFGGDAGGIQGNKGTIGGNTDGSTSVGAGGTQTEATNSVFGRGYSGATGAGGGSGYYGGTQSGTYRGAGGGSGYIGNSLLISSNGVTKHMICYGKDCKTSTAAGTLTNSVTAVSETSTADTAKMGNGFAKITLLSE